MEPVRLKPARAIVFDMDGLLLDTEVLYREAMIVACSEVGHEMTIDIHQAMIGIPRDRGMRVLLEHFGAGFPIEEFYKRCAAAFAGLCREVVPVKTGARELLRELQARKIPAAVATSSKKKAATEHLRKTGLLDMLHAVVTRDDVENGKPHPETFLTAARRLKVDPASCWALEDSHNGVRAAHAAGMATIMVPDLLEPTAEISSLCAAVLPSLHHVRGALSRTP